MQRSTPMKFRIPLAFASALALLLAGCGGSDDDAPVDKPTPAATSQDSGTSTDESQDDEAEGEAAPEEGENDSDADDPDEKDAAEAALPTKIIEAGKVSPGTTRKASGKGDALVVFKQSDPFAVVAGFECKECKGEIELQQLGAHSPLDTGKKSLSGRYLLDIIGSAKDEQTLIVRADGKWDINLRSWDDLPISSGTQQGKGAEVLYIGDAASAIEVTYKPPKGGGKLSVTATSAVQKDGDAPKVVTVSGGKKFTKKKEIELPGVLTISGKGSWTIKLIP